MSQFKPYFDVLGIKPTGDKNAIKKAYRKLAFKYHPDISEELDTQEKFIEIHEAYEILMGLRRIRKRNAKTTGSRTNSAEEIHAEKMKLAREQFERMQAFERQQELDYYNKYFTGWRWNWFRSVAIYMVLLNGFIIADYFTDGERYTIQENSFYPDYWMGMIYYQDERFPIHDYEFWEVGYPPIRMNKSYFFDDLKSISYIVNENIYDPRLPSYRQRDLSAFTRYKLRTCHSAFSIYGLFPFMNIIMLLPIGLVLYKKASFWFNILRLISVYILFTYTLVISLSNWRILHLLQLL